MSQRGTLHVIWRHSATTPRRSRRRRIFESRLVAKARLRGSASVEESSPRWPSAPRSCSWETGSAEESALEGPLPSFRQLTFRRGFITGARFAPDGQTVFTQRDGTEDQVRSSRLESTARSPVLSEFLLQGFWRSRRPVRWRSRWDARKVRAHATERSLAYRWRVAPHEKYSMTSKLPIGLPTAKSSPSFTLSTEGTDWSTRSARSYTRRTDRSPMFVSPRTASFLRSSSTRRAVSPGEWCASSTVKASERTVSPKFGILAGLAWTPAGDGVAFSAAVSGMRRWLNSSSSPESCELLARPPGNTWFSDISRDGKALILAGYARSEILRPVEGDTQSSGFDWSTPADLSSDGRWLLFHESGEGVGGQYTTLSAPARRVRSRTPWGREGDGSVPGREMGARVARPACSSPASDSHRGGSTAGASRRRYISLPLGLFLPDGRRIVIVGEQKDRPPRTYLQDLDGGPPRPFGEDGLRISVVSPDGTKLAGTTLDGRAFLFSAEGDGNDPKPIAGVEPGEFLVQWGADGKTLYVRGIEENPLTLYRVDLQTGERTLWKELRPSEEAGFLHFGVGPRSGVRVTPDGRTLVYSYLVPTIGPLPRRGARVPLAVMRD